MTGCQTCGGFGMHHDPVAHDVEPVVWHSAHVFDVADAYDAERVTAVYKCGTCFALVEAGDCEDHAAWHANLDGKR